MSEDSIAPPEISAEGVTSVSGGGEPDLGPVTMHHCAGGGGPLAMVTPLHSFDTSSVGAGHHRLSGEVEPEESSLAAAVGISSHHSGLPVHQADLQQPDLTSPDTDPAQHLPPPFSDPSDQAQFEADKRQIYK